MLVFRKIWRALFSWNTRFEIRPLPYYWRNRTFASKTLKLLRFYSFYWRHYLSQLQLPKYLTVDWLFTYIFLKTRIACYVLNNGMQCIQGFHYNVTWIDEVKFAQNLHARLFLLFFKDIALGIRRYSVIVSSRVGTPPPFLREPSPLLSGYPPLSEANLKSYPSLSEIHPNWCMQIIRNTLKWRCYVSNYTKSIENIINITLFYFQAQLCICHWHFLWLDIAINVFHIWYARGMNMKQL